MRRSTSSKSRDVIFFLSPRGLFGYIQPPQESTTHSEQNAHDVKREVLAPKPTRDIRYINYWWKGRTQVFWWKMEKKKTNKPDTHARFPHPPCSLLWSVVFILKDGHGAPASLLPRIRRLADGFVDGGHRRLGIHHVICRRLQVLVPLSHALPSSSVRTIASSSK